MLEIVIILQTFSLDILSNICPFWWKDLCALGKELEDVQDWFWEIAKKRIGNGEAMIFWHDIWIGTG